MNKSTELFSHPHQENPFPQNMSSRGLGLFLGAVVVGLVLSAGTFAVKAKEELNEEKTTPQILSARKKRWEEMTDQEKEKSLSLAVVGSIKTSYGYLTKAERKRLFVVLRKAGGVERKNQREEYAAHVLEGELKKEMNELVHWLMWKGFKTLPLEKSRAVRAEVGTLIDLGFERFMRALKKGGTLDYFG